MSADSSTLGEQVGPQFGTSQAVLGRSLDKGPPVGIQENPATQPIRDCLLGNGGVPGFSEPPSKGRLATCGINSPLQSGNVRFIHSHARYTNGFVHVNNPVCVTLNKEACTVLQMGNLKSNPMPKPKASSRRVAKPGPDGQTLGQRLAQAMAYATGRRAGVEYTESELLRDVNRMAGGPNSSLLSQQMLNAIRGNKVSRSSFTHLIAKACGVNADWLAFGIGKMTN